MLCYLKSPVQKLQSGFKWVYNFKRRFTVFNKFIKMEPHPFCIESFSWYPMIAKSAVITALWTEFLYNSDEFLVVLSGKKC
jgi:hypothetical protein